MSSDPEIIKLLRENNVEAFEELFNFYCQKLINFSRRYVFDKQVAENIVQDVFVRVWSNRNNLDPQKNLKSYLFTSVKNESLKHLRHLGVEEKGIKMIFNSMTKSENPETKFDETQLEFKIISEINKLPEKCREIFTMSRFDHLKYNEIADILNISVKTVETQMGRALKKLREKLLPFLMFVLTALSIFSGSL